MTFDKLSAKAKDEFRKVLHSKPGWGLKVFRDMYEDKGSYIFDVIDGIAAESFEPDDAILQELLPRFLDEDVMAHDGDTIRERLRMSVYDALQQELEQYAEDIYEGKISLWRMQK